MTEIRTDPARSSRSLSEPQARRNALSERERVEASPEPYPALVVALPRRRTRV